MPLIEKDTNQLNIIWSVIWAKACHWIRKRAFYISSIWAVLGVLSGVYVKTWQNTAQAELLERLQGFADPKLVAVLFLGALVILGVIGWIGTVLSSYPDKLRRWGSGVSDEVSDAATHFVAISLVIVLWHGMLGALPSWSSLWVPLGMLVPSILFYPIERSSSEPNISELLVRPEAESSTSLAIPTAEEIASYGVAFSEPAEGAKVPEEITIHGTAIKAPSPEYELWLVRRWESHPYRFYPVGKMELHRTNDKQSFEWHQEKCYVGAEPGKEQGRIFEIWRLGPESQRLFAVWLQWESRYLALREASKLPAQNWLSIPIQIKMEDMDFVTKRKFIRE